MLERHPVLKRALFNQHQLLLAAAATAVSVATLSPLPWLLLLGGNLVALPFLTERVKRRLEIERRDAEQRSQAMDMEQRYEELSPENKARFGQLRRLCQQIQANTRGLSEASLAVVGDHQRKFDAILGSCLRRLWLVQKHAAMGRGLDEPRVRAEIAQIERALARPDVQPRVREAWQQNLDIKRKLLETVARNEANRHALQAELDSLESLLQLMLQKSVAATDPSDFSAQVDELVAQAEADAASVAEMEALMGSLPELVGAPLPESLRQPAPPAPPLARRQRL